MKFDMPVNELKEYRGTNPKPDDFNEFWEKGLRDLSKQSMDYELIPANFSSRVAECYDLYFTGIGDAKIHCQLVRPKNQKEKGQLQKIGT